jgi:hypothetical protein
MSLTAIKGKRHISITRARIERAPSLYGTGQRVTLDLAGQRFGNSGAVTLHGNPVVIARVLRFLADKLDSSGKV